MQMVELERKLKTKKMRKCKLHGQGHGHHKPCVKPCKLLEILRIQNQYTVSYTAWVNCVVNRVMSLEVPE